MAVKMLNKLEIGEGNVAPASLGFERGAFSRFWALFKGNGWALMKINLLAILFILPALVWWIVAALSATADSLLLPYSANIGIGISVVTDVYDIGRYRAFLFEIRRWLVMIPLMIVMSIGLAGAFYAINRHIRGEGKPTAKIFFRGIKRYFLPFLLWSVPVSLSVFALVFTVIGFPIYTGIPTAARVIFIVLAAIALIVSVLLASFYLTQTVSYKLGAGKRLGNSLMLSAALLPRSLVILALCGLPLVPIFMQLGFFSTLFIFFFVMIGVSFLIMIVSVYCQWAYEKYINPRLREEERLRIKAEKEDKKEKLRQERRSMREAENSGGGKK